MKLSSLISIAFLSFSLLLGCATAQKRFEKMDAESRELFLAALPDLSGEQRSEFLKMEDFRQRIEYIRSNGLYDRYFHYSPQENRMVLKLSPAIEKLAIETQQGERIRDEKRVDFRVIAILAGGRRADVTDLSTYQLSAGELSGTHFTPRCARHTTTLNARFFDFVAGSRNFDIDKEITSVTLHKPFISREGEGDGPFEFELTGACSDGRRINLSCEAKWNTSGGGSVDDCGKLKVQDFGDRYYRVSARWQNFEEETSFWYHRLPKLESIEIIPAQPYVTTRSRHLFTALGRYNSGQLERLDCKVSWRADRGWFGPCGSYEAPREAGSDRVTASYAGKSADISFSVRPY